MNKKLILICTTNSILFILNFIIYLFSSSIIFYITSVVLSILFSIIFTRVILEKYRENTIEETFFITNVTHSMRNPLAKISGNAQLISLKNESSEAISILEEVNELDKMITDLLDRTIALEVLKQTCDCNISIILEKECERLKEISDNIQFNYTIDSNIIWNTNELSVKVLFSTILENSFKYGKKVISCVATTEYIVISNDTNLDNGNYDNLFTRFKRENNNEKGFGVGLSLTKMIVDQAQRKITAYVEDGTIYIKITK